MSLERSPEISCTEPCSRKGAIKKASPRRKSLLIPNSKEIRNEASIDEPLIKQTMVEQTSVKSGELFKNALSGLLKDVRRLEKIVGDMYKPKQEVKDITAKLVLKSEKLQSHDLTNWLSQAVATTKVGGRHEVDKDIPVIMDADQCDQCKKLQLRRLRRRCLLKEESFENFLNVTEEDWRNEVFPRVRFEEGSIWNAPAECEVVLPCNNNFVSTNTQVGTAINRFGGIEGLKKQNKRKGEVAMMIHSLGFPDRDDQMTYTERGIYYPVLLEDKQNLAEDETTFKALQLIKQHILKRGKTELAVPELDGVEGVMFMRILEYLFAESNIVVKMYRMNKNSQTPVAKDHRLGKSAIDNAVENSWQNKPESILVKMEGKTYAELLRSVKKSINPKELGVEVSNILKTRKGQLLLTIGNGVDKAEALKQKLSEKLPEVSTSLLTKNKVLHIRDIDEITTVDEIRASISKASGARLEAFEVRALRPAYSGKQNVTVVAPEAAADQLLQRGRIEIGWTNCRIFERKRDLTCYRCWEAGHTKDRCNGPDRQNLCLRCSKDGHLAKNCLNPPYCVHCKLEGHQSSSSRCPVNERNIEKRIKRNADESTSN